MKIRKRFDSLSPARKKICIWSLAGALILSIIVIGYNSTRSPKKDHPATADRAREITLEPELIQKTLLREQRQEIEDIQQQLADLKKERAALSKNISAGRNNSTATESPMPDIPSAEQVAEQTGNRFSAPHTGFMVPPPAAATAPGRGNDRRHRQAFQQGGARHSHSSGGSG